MDWVPADDETYEVVNKSHAFLFFKVMGKYVNADTGRVSLSLI